MAATRGISNRRSMLTDRLHDEKLCLSYFSFLSPEPFKPCRIRRRVHDGVLNVPVPKIVLNEPRVCPLIGQGEAASVAEHVRVGGQGEARPARHSCGSPAMRSCGSSGLRRSLTKKASGLGSIFARSLSHVLIIFSSSLRSGCVVESPFFRRCTCSTRLSMSTCDKLKAGRLRHAQTVPKHQEQKATVAGLVPAALGGGYELVHLVRG